MVLTMVFSVGTALLFMLAALAAYFFHEEFVGGKNSREWKMLYAGLILLSVSHLLFVVSRGLEIQVLEPGSEVMFFMSSSVLCVSCFMFWNKFRL